MRAKEIELQNCEKRYLERARESSSKLLQIDVGGLSNHINELEAPLLTKIPAYQTKYHFHISLCV